MDSHPTRNRRRLFGRRDWDHSRDLLCILHLDGTFKEANRALESALGYERHELEGRSALGCVHPDDLERAEVERARLAEGNHLTSGFEVRYQRKDGGWIWLEWTARASIHEGLIYASAREISERKRRELELEKAARVDPLTGLANRRGFERALERELAAARRHSLCPALVVVDLDRFKEINDRYGHGVGDDMLVTTARTLEKTLRASDLAARIGGDEFAALLPNCDEQTAQLVAGKIIEALGAGKISASAGVALLGQPDVENGGDLLTAADRAMYRAKRRRSSFALHESPSSETP